jgi:hypothetical protein
MILKGLDFSDKTVIIDLMDVGNPVDDLCPQCGSTLLESLRGQLWCSCYLCSYGIVTDVFKLKPNYEDN